MKLIASIMLVLANKKTLIISFNQYLTIIGF